MTRKTASFPITARNSILPFLILSLFLVTPFAAHADNANEGLRNKFQLRLNDAWHKLVAGEPRKKRAPFNIAPGEAHLMTCSPKNVSSHDKKFAISFGGVDIPKDFSLIFVDEFQKLLVVAGSASGAYIDDNTIQPELIKRNSTVTTEPGLTYAHMDDTGYPHPAFGPSGTYAILLVDNAINFERRRVTNKASNVVTSNGKVPGIVAGCTVSWKE